MANLPRKEKTEVAAESTGHVEPTPAKTRLAAGPPPAGNAVLPAIPEHQLLRSVGRGSYGEVWLARNVMGTYRAVKVVYRKNFENDRPYEREFDGIQKFEPISRSHDGLVDILQVGRNDEAGYFYYVMELADDANAECGMRNVPSPTQEVRALRIPNSALRIRTPPAPSSPILKPAAGCRPKSASHWP